MRMSSCNGCRVLRKGCGDGCSIRPCLDWIKSPESQGHATIFLAKFYGRAGLMNLVNAGTQQLRPAIFRSLLYEACGRIVNPIYGSVGLLCSGSWQLCHDAVDAVLRGEPVTQVAPDASAAKDGHHLMKACDIRHVDKEGDAPRGSKSSLRLRNRRRFKRTGAKRAKRTHVVGSIGEDDVSKNMSQSHESSLSHQSEETNVESEGLALEEPELASPQEDNVADNGREIELDLTLGFEPYKGCMKPKELAAPAKGADNGEAGLCNVELGLDYSTSA